jgi:hypothetical protein
MKRFRRWLFNAMAALSLLLCLAAVALQLRCGFARDEIFYNARRSGGNSIITIQWNGGIIGHAYFTIDPPPNVSIDQLSLPKKGWSLVHYRASRFPGDQPSIFFHYFGPSIRSQWTIYDPWHTVWNSWVKIWYLAILAAILPAVWIWRLASKRKAAMQGCCVKCGYDLRATPDRCPECGTVASKKEIISN